MNGFSTRVRCWNKKTKTMYPSVPIFKTDFFHCENIDDLVLMFGTGLRDRNGNEIFEGDVIKFDDYKITYYVKWYDADASWRFHNDKKGGMGMAGCNDIAEVIGHIYEV